ncbi:hypothetical protein EBR25_12485 [bacterium]|nr:hypothetical protein [bacterium]
MSITLENLVSVQESLVDEKMSGLQATEASQTDLHPTEQVREVIVGLALENSDFRQALESNEEGAVEQAIRLNCSHLKEIFQSNEINVFVDSVEQVHLVVPSADRPTASYYENSKIGRVLLEAATDPELKASLLEDPKGVLAEMVGTDFSTLSENLKIQILVENKNSMHIVVPELSQFTPDDGDLDRNTINNTTSCLSCHCVSASQCLTGQCMSSHCVTFSSKCK